MIARATYDAVHRVLAQLEETGAAPDNVEHDEDDDALLFRLLHSASK